MSALERSGENRIQLVRALARVSSSELPAMCDMISRMPNYDLTNITAKMLLDHIDCTFEMNSRVPWKLATNSKLFLDYVLPYRIASESLENSRRDIMKKVYPEIKGCSNVQKAVSKLLTFLANSKITGIDIGSCVPYDYPPFGAWKFSNSPSWNCRARSMIAVGILRSVGIPSGIVCYEATLWHNPAHTAIWYFDPVTKKMTMCEADDQTATGDILNAHFHNDGTPILYTYPPYMSSDLLGRRIFEKMPSLGTYKCPYGTLTVVLKENGSPVSNAWVGIYVWLRYGKYWIPVYKSRTDSTGNATFNLGSTECFNSYMLSASKNNKSTNTFLHVMPGENVRITMDIAKPITDASVDIGHTR